MKERKSILLYDTTSGKSTQNVASFPMTVAQGEVLSCMGRCVSEVDIRESRVRLDVFSRRVLVQSLLQSVSTFASAFPDNS
jgi:hypothetical protein